ncbi:unnamed protein product [Phytomonas sp. EM1]|nr:unnamed protein product [Phytomonas sp. EM1]|eukprot:CCW62969.1 unnamed protein product [Phytomonas sp. isolate EM1]
MSIGGLCNHNSCSATSLDRPSDDGHIVVCVRVRNVPSNLDVPQYEMQKSMRPLSHSRQICVSVVENIVVMHDPKNIDDAYAVERDSTHVMNLLTDHGKSSLKGGAASYSSKKTNYSLHSRSPLMSRSVNSLCSSTFTGTTNCYVCDQCVVSMDAPSILMMPLLRSTNFFRSPAFGTQAAVYHATAVHAVKAALGGINSCVFTYGQTGSGKTYTLFGDHTSAHHDPGLATRTLEDIFLTLDDLSSAYAKGPVTQDFKYTVLLSFMEIYRNEVFCLLSGKGPLRVRLARDADGAGEGAVIDGLLQAEVCTAEAAHRLLKAGLRRRRVGRTNMNASSSRSHAILQIRVAQWRTNHHTQESIEHSAKISLVDLAGSERQRTAGTQQGKPADGIHINQSLTALSRVINDVACGAKFINYRDSLLTMILKDSLGGNSKTFMIANISPIALNYEESCATLTYSSAVRRICNRFTANCIIHKYLNPLMSNLHSAEEGSQGLVERMEDWVRHLKGVSNSRHGYVRTLSGFPTKKQTSVPTKNSCPLKLSCRREHEICEAIINTIPSGPLRAPLIFVSHRKRLKTAEDADPNISDISDLVRIVALENDLLELNLAQLIQSDSLIALSKPANDVAVIEPVMANVAEQQFMIQKEVARAMEARITPLLEKTLFESYSSESSHSYASAKDKDEIRTAIGSISSPNTGCSASHNPLPTNFGCLNFERDSPDDGQRLFYVYFIPFKGMECSQRAVDVQVNGNRLGENRHALRHGDVVCITFQDGNFRENMRDHLVFHYIDLNYYNENILPDSDAWSGCLDPDTEPLTVSSRCVVEEIGQVQHNVARAIEPASSHADDNAFKRPFEEKPLHKVAWVSHALPNSPSPQLPSSSPDREHSPLLRDSSQGLMYCVSSPSLRSPTRIVGGTEHNIGSAPAPPRDLSWDRLDPAVKENKSLSSHAAHHNTLFNPIVERGLDALQGIWIPEQRRSGISGDNASWSGDQRATNMMISDDLKDTSFPEVSQIERSITRVSPSSDEGEELMVSSARPTVYQNAMFAEAAVTCDDGVPSSTIPIVAPSVDPPQGKGLTITPRLSENILEKYSKVVWEASPRNHISGLQTTILNLEAENRKLQEENRQCKESLKKFKNSIDSLQGAKMGAIVDPEQSPVAGQRLEQLVIEQDRTIEELRRKATHLEQLASSKEGEIRAVLRYVEDGGLMSIDGDSHFIELHHRIEELISEGISKQVNTPATAGSVFLNDFNSNELTALICVSLRILFNRLKNEIFAINKQSLERMSFILDSVSQCQEVQLSRFTLELREIVSDLVGRPQRSGARWSLTAEDVSSGFVKHYRDRAIDTFYSMLIWYDTWDLSSRIEYVCGMELIRNADRIIQIARQVRQGGLHRCDMTVAMPGLLETAKQDVSAVALCLVEGGGEGAKPSQRVEKVVSKVAENGPCMQMPKDTHGSALDQLGKVQMCHNRKADAAKAMISSRRSSHLGNSTSLQSSSRQASRSKGLVSTGVGLAPKNKQRLVTEKKIRAPRKGATTCSSENETQALPVRRHKFPLQASEEIHKGVRVNRGDLLMRTRSLTSLSSAASFTRYNTTIPSLGRAPGITGNGLHRESAYHT